MLVPVIAIATMHFFAVALATLTTRSDPYPINYKGSGTIPPSCSGDGILPIKNMESFWESLIFLDGAKEKYYEIYLPVDHCTQVACEQDNAILYCHHVSIEPTLNRAMATNLFPVHIYSPMKTTLRS
jgi:hypothetical protein